MVLAVHKTRKRINKKGGDIKALHENSRGIEAPHLRYRGWALC